MKSLLLFILIATQLSARAQPGNSSSAIDGLKEQLRKSQSDTGRILLLHALAGSYTKGSLSPADSGSVFAWLTAADHLCDSLAPGFTGLKYKTLSLLVDACVLSGNFTRGEVAFMKLVNACRAAGDKWREADSWYKYGTALMVTGKDPKITDSVLTQAVVIYHEIHAPKNELDAGMMLNTFKIRVRNFRMAEQQLLSLIKLSEANAGYRLPHIYYQLSFINRYEGNFNKALGYALHAVKLTKRSNDTGSLHSYYGEVAQIYEELDQPAESALWYQRCIAAREKKAGYLPFPLYRTYGLMVTQLIKAGKQQEALAIILDLRNRRPPNSLAERGALALCLAYCYEGVQEYPTAEKYFLECISLYQKAPVYGEIELLALHDIVSFYVRSQQYNKTTPFLEKILSIGQQVMSTKMIGHLQLLQFKVDSAAGNYIAAIGHFQQYKSLQDSMFNAVKSKQIGELQVQYQTEIKDQNIQLLTKKDQVQQLSLRQATTTRNTILVVTVLLLLLLALGYNRYRLKQKSNLLLEQQQQEINQQNTSLQHLVEEKEWLVKEIHHRVKNNFHIVMSLLGTQANYLKHEEAKLAMNEAQQRIHAMSLIHQKLYQSENLSSVNMADYIHELVDYLRDSMDASIHIRFDLQVEPVFLPITHSLPIGLILNEAITNAIKHAFPDDREKRISIALQHAGEHDLVLTVADNGVGIPAHFETDHHDSMGMGLMQGLSDDIRGLFSIEQQEGTLITVRFTYKATWIPRP